MKVFVYPDKVYREFGETRWVCEWATLRSEWEPQFDGDSPDFDSDLITHRTFHRSQEKAVAAMSRVSNEDYYGCPIVYQQIVDWYVEEDSIAEWVEIGERVYENQES